MKIKDLLRKLQPTRSTRSDDGILARHEGRAHRRFNRLCVFAHNDPWNCVDPHVLHYLRGLRESGCDVLFVSTSSALRETDIQAVGEFCFQVWLRKNQGYDFGSFQAGLAPFADDPQYAQILLANDSVYGPMYPLEEAFAQMDGRGLDVWSMTDSLQVEYHLQSYFLVFNRAAIDHPLMRRFWFDQLFVETRKDRIVKEFEIGLSRVCKKASLRIGAWAEYRKVARRALQDFANRVECLNHSRLSGGHLELDVRNMADVLAEDSMKSFARNLLTKPCNPTHELWNYLITEFRHPFLKVELMKKNPVAVRNLWTLDSVVPGSYPLDLIQNHLKRVA